MILLTCAASALVVIVYVAYVLSRDDEFPAIDLSHPVYAAAQMRANMTQRTHVITFNKLTNSYCVKLACNVWPSDEDPVLGVIHPQPNKQLKLVK